MDKKPTVVYLEDLETSTKTVAKENVAVTAEKTAVTTTESDGTKTTEKKTATGATKRQKSLMDMFSKVPSNASSSTSSAPAAKRAKTLSANPSLNSIPFSLTEFQNTFSDEEKKLLALECETMGMSW